MLADPIPVSPRAVQAMKAMHYCSEDDGKRILNNARSQAVLGDREVRRFIQGETIV